MGAISPQGGDRELVSSTLPQEAFDDLSAGIWKLGQVIIPKELEDPIAPSTVYAFGREVGALAVDLSFDFVLNDLGVPEAKTYAATIAEQEPYTRVQGAKLASWRSLELNLGRRTMVFARGSSILTNNGRIDLKDVRPQKNMPRRRGAWQTARALASICTTDDYYWFAENLQTMAETLRSENL